MQIHITGRHFEVTDDIRAYVEKRANKVEVIFNRIIDLQVVIEMEKSCYTAHGQKLRSIAKCEDRACQGTVVEKKRNFNRR